MINKEGRCHGDESCNGEHENDPAATATLQEMKDPHTPTAIATPTATATATQQLVEEFVCR